MDNIDKVVLDGFYTCSRSRVYTNEGTPLPLGLGQIKDYLSIFRIPLDSELFTECVMALDDVYIEHVYDQLSKKSKQKGNGGNSKSIPI